MQILQKSFSKNCLTKSENTDYTKADKPLKMSWILNYYCVSLRAERCEDFQS